MISVTERGEGFAKVVVIEDGEELNLVLKRKLASGAEIKSLLANLELSVVLFQLSRRFLLRQLSIRALHTSQAKKLLLELGLDEALASKAIASLDSYFDDQNWVQGRLNRWAREGKSALQVRAKLQEAGAKKVEYDEGKALGELIQKKYSKILQASCPKEVKQKAIQSLMRRGFQFSLINSILKENMVSSLVDGNDEWGE